MNQPHPKLNIKDRYYISAREHNNCALCIIEAKGKLSQAEVAQVLGISKMRVSQIERSTIDKLKRMHN